MNDKIHGHVGDQIILSTPKTSARPTLLIWKKKSTFIADITNNNIFMSKNQPEPNKYNLFLNGSLKINRLKKMDAGTYIVEAHGEKGTALFRELITLQVDELLLELNEFCSQKTLTCEAKYSGEPKPRFKLFQDTKEIESVQPEYYNATWKVTLQLNVSSGKFRCEVDVPTKKNYIEKQITCPVADVFYSVPMLFIILIIVGSVVILIIFLALIIYCIRRKKAKRREREAEEYALQIQIQNHMQQRKLPEIPVSSGSTPTTQKSRSPPSELQQQIAPSKSCPYPKPPRRTKERL
ncbi:PREDICTED: T-cell surface antigen CD2 [Thamnophis sirtalis]|uniref:T-cell surface antigen CD2 n=1 Tax=Thamnophis sirtalis TaxID=35019 RepID=A0A6I9XX63_9SAUR|nr:PREDICTED: T-cell surface antigen CD2 [Thamnophis sirtalis]